uniref:Uncharacterized protein n=1 Tax=Glossina austeni TaxID=7395 RepID=A0A1A9VMX5_GLOAU
MRRNTNLDSNIILCSAHFALGIISIWALKYVNIKASNSYCESIKLHLNNFFMVWNISIITSIAFRQTEPYWLIGMVALLILNHFILNAILKSIHTTSLHSHEVSVIGLCFFTIFALNSVNEICSS